MLLLCRGSLAVGFGRYYPREKEFDDEIYVRELSIIEGGIGCAIWDAAIILTRYQSLPIGRHPFLLLASCILLLLLLLLLSHSEYFFFLGTPFGADACVWFQRSTMYMSSWRHVHHLYLSLLAGQAFGLQENKQWGACRWIYENGEHVLQGKRVLELGSGGIQVSESS